MKLSFYFDFLSPYSYLAWCWLREFVEQNSHEIELFPVTLANIIHAQETKGPAEIPAKREYLMRDLLRITAEKGIPFCPPKPLPFNSLYALRISLIECCGEKQLQVVDSFYRAAWEEGRDIGDAQVVEEVLNALELPVQEMLDRVGSKELRKQLKVNTKMAIEQGIFGLPTFLVHNGGEKELFWGYDSTSFLMRYLDGDDPLNLHKLKSFQESYLTLS